MSKLYPAALLWIMALPLLIAAQGPERTHDDLLLLRIEDMEKQLVSIQAEIKSLRSQLGARSESEEASNAKPAAKSSIDDDSATKKDSSTVPAASKEKAQIGVDLGNGLKLVPYGTVYFNAFGNTGGTNNIDVPMWATASDEKNVGSSLRQTRFGARIEGAKIGDASVTGVIEADFYGGLPAVGVGENFGVVRLRVAKVKFDWEHTSLAVGQDWIIFAPNNPVSIAAAAIPQFAAAGNPWARLPQVRVEHKFGDGRFLYQGAVLSPTSGDFPSGSNTPLLLQPGAAAASSVPSFESRLAYTGGNWFGTGKSGSIAVSGHYGRARVSNTGIDSLGVAADWNFPLAKRVGLAGELFFGRNIGGLQAGIFQGYNADFGRVPEGSSITAGVRGIGTRGGWTQISFTPDVLRDRLTLYGSIGLDDPRNEDLTSVTPRNWRSRNLAYAFNFIFKPVPRFSLGAEIRRFETWYILTGKETAEHFNFGAAYNF